MRALNTAGRAVLFAGGTVCIALLGLLVLSLSFLNGLAYASVITVRADDGHGHDAAAGAASASWARACSAAASAARLAESGPQDGHATGFWARWARFVSRRPRHPGDRGGRRDARRSPARCSACASACRTPATTPPPSTTRKAYDLLAAGFGPGSNGPLLLVAQIGLAGRHGRARPARRRPCSTVPGVAAVVPFPSKPGAKVAIVAGHPRPRRRRTCATSDLIKHLRNDVIPPPSRAPACACSWAARPRSSTTSPPSSAAKLPLFIGVIVGLGFLLLLVAFRSLLVPATAAVMNLLAAAASFGVVVAFFQWGWGSDAARPRARRARRGLPAGDHARRAVRPLHGLPGVPGQPHARGVGAHAATTATP